MNTTPSGPQGQVTAEIGLSGRDSVIYFSSATAATYAMTTRTRTLILTTSGAHLAVTLPSVTEAAGMIFTVFLAARGGSYNVTVDDAGDDESQVQYTLDAASDRGIFYSDGVHWHNIISDAAAAT